MSRKPALPGKIARLVPHIYLHDGSPSAHSALVATQRQDLDGIQDLDNLQRSDLYCDGCASDGLAAFSNDVEHQGRDLSPGDLPESSPKPHKPGLRGVTVDQS